MRSASIKWYHFAQVIRVDHVPKDKSHQLIRHIVIDNHQDTVVYTFTYTDIYKTVSIIVYQAFQHHLPKFVIWLKKGECNGGHYFGLTMDWQVRSHDNIWLLEQNDVWKSFAEFKRSSNILISCDCKVPR